jgi:Uma2 family endonuclease
MSAQPKPNTSQKMTVSEFFRWAESQSERYELVRGNAVVMQSERLRHVIVKGSIYSALEAAIQAANLPCIVFSDGATVVISNDTAYEPDAIVQCSPLDDLDGVVVSRPTIVVEVQSPSSEVADTTTKLGDYMTVPSIVHILVVDPKLRRVMHHERQVNGAFLTRLSGAADELVFATPGFKMATARFFNRLDGPKITDTQVL